MISVILHIIGRYLSIDYSPIINDEVGNARGKQQTLVLEVTLRTSSYFKVL